MQTKYSNIRIRGDDSGPKVASYNATSTSPILERASDWMLSVSRFYLTTTRLPIYINEVPNATQNVYKLVSPTSSRRIFYKCVSKFKETVEENNRAQQYKINVCGCGC